MSIMNIVRSAIAESHQQIELTPFSQGMMNGALSRAEYSNGLVQLWHIHDELENSIQKTGEIAEYFTAEMVRTGTIAKDLRAFGYGLDSFNPMKETLDIVSRIRDWSVNQPHALLGCIYILEGSRMGSLVIAKPLSQTLGLASGTTSGIEYHTEGAHQTPTRLKTFKAKIESAGLNESDAGCFVKGAVEFMDMLNKLYASLLIEDVNRATPQRKTA